MYDIVELDELQKGDKVIVLDMHDRPQIGTFDSLIDGGILIQESPLDHYFDNGQIALIERAEDE